MNKNDKKEREKEKEKKREKEKEKKRKKEKKKKKKKKKKKRKNESFFKLFRRDFPKKETWRSREFHFSLFPFYLSKIQRQTRKTDRNWKTRKEGKAMRVPKALVQQKKKPTSPFFTSPEVLKVTTTTLIIQVLSLLASLSHYFPFKQATNNEESRDKFVCFLFLSLLSSLSLSFSFLSLFFLFLSLFLSFSLSFSLSLSHSNK